MDIDLAQSDNFVENIRSLQDEYRSLQKRYTGNNQAQSDKVSGVAEQIIDELVRDTCVLHQVQL